MQTGRLLKAYGGYFFIYDSETDQTYEGKIRGKLKEQDVEVMPGDRVKFTLLDDGTAIIEDRLERDNALFRPPIANVEQIVITFAVQEPDLNLKLLDRLLVLGTVAQWEANLNLLLCFKTLSICSSLRSFFPYIPVKS